jgi:hypothetical protein
LVTFAPPTGRTAVWNGEPSTKSVRSIVPAPMSATATPRSRSVGDRTASAEARPADELVDLHVRRRDALREVLDRGRGGGDDVRLDFQAHGAHAERVHHAFLAVHRVAARDDVEHLPRGRDGDRAGDLDGAVDVLLGDLAPRPGDGHLAR